MSQLCTEIVKRIYELCGVSKVSNFPLLAFKSDKPLVFTDEDDNSINFTTYFSNIIFEKKNIVFLYCKCVEEDVSFLFVQYNDTPAYGLKLSDVGEIYIHLNKWVSAPEMSQATVLLGMEQLFSIPIEGDKYFNEQFLEKAKDLIINAF